MAHTKFFFHQSKKPKRKKKKNLSVCLCLGKSRFWLKTVNFHGLELLVKWLGSIMESCAWFEWVQSVLGAEYWRSILLSSIWQVVIGSIMNKLHSSEDELFFYSDAPLQSGFPNVLFLYLGNHMYLLKIVELLKEIIGIHTQTDWNLSCIYAYDLCSPFKLLKVCI